MQLCHMRCARSVLNMLPSCAAVQHLSHLGGFFFCFFFLKFESFDGRIKNLNSKNSFVSEIFKGRDFFFIIKLVD